MYVLLIFARVTTCTYPQRWRCPASVTFSFVDGQHTRVPYDCAIAHPAHAPSVGDLGYLSWSQQTFLPGRWIYDSGRSGFGYRKYLSHRTIYYSKRNRRSLSLNFHAFVRSSQWRGSNQLLWPKSRDHFPVAEQTTPIAQSH